MGNTFGGSSRKKKKKDGASPVQSPRKPNGNSNGVRNSIERSRSLSVTAPNRFATHSHRRSLSLTVLAPSLEEPDSPAKQCNSSSGNLVIGKKLIQADPLRVVKAWCSWCSQKTHHGRIQKKLFFVRSVYKCQVCTHRTVPCRWCSQMARGHTDWDDELCSCCNGLITSWETCSKQLNSTMGYCSWCFHFTPHSLRDTSIVLRDSYCCDGCGGPTSTCVACRRNFARCGSFYNELLCALCRGSINSWSSILENIKKHRPATRFRENGIDSFRSFAPKRRNVKAEIVIDGEDFFLSLAGAIESASESIYLSFWHFNYFIYLRRSQDGIFRMKDRMDQMLLEAATRGVNVYILLWRESLPQLQCNNFSLEMKKYLTDLHPRIFCIRHGHPTPWNIYVCHHQKFVVVDQDVALVGGLDVCLGRFDDHLHRITDFYSETWPGVDYYNPHIARPTGVDQFTLDVVDRSKVPRMPWHDVDICVYGEAARDVARNFVERWNHHKDVAYPHKSIPSLSVKKGPANESFNCKGSCTVQVIRSLDLWSGGSRLEQSIYGEYLKAVTIAEHYIYIENQYLSSSIAGEGVENVVFQRILDKLRSKIRAGEVFKLILTLPQPEEVGTDLLEILRWQYQTLNRGGSSILEQLTFVYFIIFF